MRRLLVLCAFSAACSNHPLNGAGLTAIVKVGTNVKADCIVVAASPAAGGNELITPPVARKAELEFGIANGAGLTGAINVVARGYLGSCSGPLTALVLNAQSTTVMGTLTTGSASGTVTLELTAALDDADLDGYGKLADCDDTNPAINPGALENCSDGIDNDCNTKIDCADTPKCDNTACDDGQSCSSNDKCTAGACMGTSPACNTPTGPCFHNPGSCRGDGGCVYPVAIGSACDGGVCTSNGSCVPPGGELNCSDGIDNDGDGKIDCLDSDCTNQLCNDHDLCTVGETCQADAGCAGATRDCSTPPGQCFDAGFCAPGSGSCVFPIALGKSCDDGNPCTSADRCGGDAGCDGTPKTCTTPNNSCFVKQGSCDLDSGSCVYAVDAGAPCNDNQTCTLNDVCSPTGQCLGAAFNCNNPPECMGAGNCLSDGGCSFSPLTGGTCQAGAGFCVAGACVMGVDFGYAPSNFTPPDAGWSPPVDIAIGCDPGFDSTGAGTFDKTCSNVMPTPQAVTLSDGQSAILLTFSSLTVDTGATFTIHGDKPVILAARGAITIAGTLDASSKRTNPGPGGNYTLCGVGTGNVGVSGSANRGSGAGGGGFGTAGSPGAGVDQAGGGAGGSVNGTPELVPLRGGCPGAAGGSNSNDEGNPGVGGGALQLSSSTTLTITGVIAASGSGGQGGRDHSAGAGGAGSGGALLLEGGTVFFANGSKMLTNGGGGGEGANNGGSSATGNNGANGSSSTSNFAAGGQGGTSAGGDGANGAAGVPDAGGFVAAGGQSQAQGGSQGGGGGGGGVGRIYIRGIIGCTLATSGAASGSVGLGGVCH